MIRYEEATLEDAYGIEYVSSHSWKETYSGIIDDKFLDDRIANIENRVERTKNYLQEFRKTHDGNYIVAKDDDKVIGFVTYHEDEHNDNGYIGALYLLKEYQGQGIGKELFKIAVIGLIEMGYSKMKLECLVGNNTINFYKKYLAEEVAKSEYEIDGKKYDTVMLEFNDLESTLELLKEKRK